MIRPEPTAPFANVEALGVDVVAGHVLSSWRRELSERSELSVQAYYDALSRDEELLHDYSARTVDAELQHRFAHSSRFETTWGLGVRSVWSRLGRGSAVRSPAERDSYRYLSAFVQEEIQVRPDRLALALGIKVEDSTLGGVTPQPSARVIWTPDPETAVWGAVSRATRIPSWGEQNASFEAASFEGPFGVGVVGEILPSPALGNETLTAYESGIRLQPQRRVSLDLAAFYNQYENLRSLELGELEFVTEPVPHLRLPTRFANDKSATSYGLELAARWHLHRAWRLTATHSYLKMRLQAPSGGLIEEFDHRQAPTHRSSLRSSWDLSRLVSLDVSGYYVSRSLAGGFLYRGEELPAYLRADARFEWRVNERLRVSGGVQNLSDAKRTEFQPQTLIVGGPVGRNVFGRVQWLF